MTIFLVFYVYKCFHGSPGIYHVFPITVVLRLEKSYSQSLATGIKTTTRFNEIEERKRIWDFTIEVL